MNLFLLLPAVVFSASGNEVKSHPLQSNTSIKNWLIAGPFSATDMDYYEIYSFDFLESVGGEAETKLSDFKIINYKDDEGKEKSVKVINALVDSNGVLNFEKYYDDIDFNVVYAYTQIFSKTDQNAYFMLGSDDGVKVWVNGELSFYNNTPRGLTPREDRFAVHLKQGYNSLLVKVTDYVRQWALVVEVFDSSAYSLIQLEEKEKIEFLEFLNCKLEVIPSIESEITFYPGKFPELRWNKPYLVKKFAGDLDLRIKWFDKNLNEVSTPDNPGRYAYYAEGIIENGFTIRRAATLYCFPEDWLGWSERPLSYPDYMPLSSIDKVTWQKNKDVISAFVGRMLYQSALHQEDAAILLSFLDEQNDSSLLNDKSNTPILRDQDYHTALKQKVLGLENKWPEFKPPLHNSESSSIVLKKGSEQEAGFKDGAKKSIMKLCEEWFTSSGEPFDILIARNGTIIINEAFGEDEYGKFTTDTPTEIASTTKLLTGLLFGEFVYQGLISIDDPVGNYLPDYPIEGTKALTMRHLFTHTSGLLGHGTWGGVHNPWLDNVIANLLPELPVGEIYLYNGNGYNLAGKVMEIVSGKGVFRLMRENLFDPLDMNNTVLDEDLAYGCHSTAFDMAKIGQLLLNKGSYGDLEFFSPQTFEKLLPEPLDKYYPIVNDDIGIGITWMRYQRPEREKSQGDKSNTILSKNVVGHGSATSAVLMVDLDNGIVITQSRRNGGNYFDEYLTKLLLLIEKNLISN
ncbi:MAG: beta-lactamase family protein [Ignavibacterium sp.]|nr:MAG: beta-lactamase family protein [Ignavibacterium sp.]